VMHFSERLVVLVAGRKIADGAPQDVVRNPEVERAYLGE
jgi:branched-chain amino acid transport system ATP-binding protein